MSARSSTSETERPAAGSGEPLPAPLQEKTYGPAQAAIRRELRWLLAQLQPMPAVALIASGLCLWVYESYGSQQIFRQHIARWLGLSGEDTTAGGYFYWFGSAFVMLMLLPIAIVAITNRFVRPADRVPVRNLGLGLGEARVGIPACALFYGVMFVIVAVIARFDSFQEYYPIYGEADRSMAMFVSYEIAYALYFIAWEFFFRGFMTFALEKHLGIWVIFVQMLPFAVMHFGKPGLESMSSVFGGIALGYLALRSRSIWYGVFIHAATAVTLDVLVVGIRWYRG